MVFIGDSGGARGDVFMIQDIVDGTPRNSWYGVLYTLCLCYMLFLLYILTRICIWTSYYCELVVGLRVQFYTLLEVWGGWELGC